METAAFVNETIDNSIGGCGTLVLNPTVQIIFKLCLWLETETLPFHISV